MHFQSCQLLRGLSFAFRVELYLKGDPTRRRCAGEHKVSHRAKGLAYIYGGRYS
jgi:hypothetical protein